MQTKQKTKIISVGFEQIKQFGKLRDSTWGDRYFHFYEDKREMPNNLYVDVFPLTQDTNILLYSPCFFNSFEPPRKEIPCSKVNLIKLYDQNKIIPYLRALQKMNQDKFTKIIYAEPLRKILGHQQSSSNDALFYWGELTRFFNVNLDLHNPN